MNTTERPILSILVPTWNRVDEVLRAVRSAEVTSSDVEIVIVDNASDVHVYEQLQAELALIPGIRLFRNDRNIGMVRNWNACIARATGTWMGLLCSDDQYLDGGVTRALELIKATHYPALILQDPAIQVPQEVASAGSETVRTLALPIASGNFWHREIVERLGGFDERFEYSADAEYWYRIAAHYPVIKVRDSLASYHQHETNYMWQTWRKPDFLEQTELLSRTVLSYRYVDSAASYTKIESELDEGLWNTLLTIEENSFLQKGKSDIFFRYFPQAIGRAHGIRRPLQLLGRLVLSAIRRIFHFFIKSSTGKRTSAG